MCGIFSSHVIDCKFSTECVSERMLKNGQYLAKIWTKVWQLFFFIHGVYVCACHWYYFEFDDFNRMSSWLSRSHGSVRVIRTTSKVNGKC